jgi:hypothetical protein
MCAHVLHTHTHTRVYVHIYAYTYVYTYVHTCAPMVKRLRRQPNTLKVASSILAGCMGEITDLDTQETAWPNG